MYPEFALINGDKYKLNTDYRVALKCFEIIDDKSIGDGERAMAVIFLLFGFIPDGDLTPFLDKAVYFLSCGDPSQTASEKDFDFNFDSGFIMSSFMSDYRLDLASASLHFWQYIDLITGLSKDCVLSRVRDIRNCDLNEISDREERKRMARAQAQLSLPDSFSAEEQAAIDEFDRLFLDVMEG